MPVHATDNAVNAFLTALAATLYEIDQFEANAPGRSQSRPGQYHGIESGPHAWELTI